MLPVALLEAARLYFDQGYTCIPLGMDIHGRPKKPLPLAWSSLPHDWPKIATQSWSKADGLGIVLGEASANLAVIDIDDEDMAGLVLAKCKRTRAIKTIRGRAHVYVREEQPSRSRVIPVRWGGKVIKIELKGQGTQVAAPPTPGYEHIGARDREPIVVTNVADAWQRLADWLGATLIDSEDEGPGGYPHPWRESVGEGDRNKSVYVESHKLRESGMSVALAMDIMRARYETHYVHKEITWGEIEQTIKSAYRKGEVNQHKEQGRDELSEWF